jgi:hypothetical protein
VNELVQRALSIAATQVGVREHTRNDGWEIESYCRDIGHDPNARDPWCAIFVCAMFRRAADQMGIRCPVPLVAGCFTLDERSPQDVHVSAPAPGAIFITKGHKHCGLVVGVADGGHMLHTIEGNTNDGGSPEGDGVYDRSRKASDVQIYLDFSRVDLSTLTPPENS